MIPIFATGFPKSGITWLIRLLSDLLDSPIKTPAPDNATVMRFCKTGKGGYAIYKTHWMPHERDNDAPIIFIQRDPRDVAVSAMYYSGAPSLMHTLGTMMIKHTKHPKYKFYHNTGAYKAFITAWTTHSSAVKTRYELLHDDPINELGRVVHLLTGKKLSATHIKRCCEHQEFDRWVALYKHSMRKGIAGDWKNHFTREHGEFITEHLGELMLEMRYIEELEWWKGL